MNPNSEQALRTLARTGIDRAAKTAEHRIAQRTAYPNEMMQAMTDARQLFREQAATRYSPDVDGDRRLYISEADRIFDDVKNER